MDWHKVSFTEQEVEDGAPGQFEKQFRTLYAAEHSPVGAALFSNEIASAGIEYYLSPEAARIAANLLTQYSSISCPRPDPDDVRLTLGPRGAETLLQ